MSRLRRYGLIGNQPLKSTAADKPTGVISTREVNEQQSQGNYYYSPGKMLMVGWGTINASTYGTLTAWSRLGPNKYVKTHTNSTAPYAWDVMPGGTGSIQDCMEWSKDGRYLAVGATDALFVYKYNENSTFSLLFSDVNAAGGSRCRAASWSDDGQFLVSGALISDVIKFYRRDGDTITAQTAPTIGGQTLTNAKMSPDGNYCIALCGSTTTGMRLLKRSVDTWSVVWTSTAGTGPGGGTPCAGQWIDNTTFVVYTSLPTVAVFTRSGDTLTKTAIATDVAITSSIASNSASYCNSCILLRQAGKVYVLFACNNTDPWITVYEYTGSALVKQTGLSGSTGGPGGTEYVYQLTCTTDGSLVASSGSGGATALARPLFYNFNQGTLTPVTSQVLNGIWSTTSYGTYSVSFQP